MVKVVGKEWNRFYSDAEAWPDGAWHEDEEITLDGKPIGDDFDLSTVPDAAVLTVANGAVYFRDTAAGPSLEAHFKRWRKQQATIYFVVEAPREVVDGVRAAVAASGGKVLGA